MKRIILLMAMIVLLLTPMAVFAQEEINVSIMGVPVDFEGQGPALVDGRTLVPVRGVFEMIGFEVEWYAPTQTITMQAGEMYEIIVQVGSETFTTNGEEYTLEVPAQIVDGRTMLPIRAVLESIGLYVGWDAATSTVLVAPSNGEPQGGAEEVVSTFMRALMELDNDILVTTLSEQLMAVDFGSALLAPRGSVLSYTVEEGMSAAGLEFFDVTMHHTMGTAVYSFMVQNGLIANIVSQRFDFELVPVPENAPFEAIPVVLNEGTSWAIEGFLTMPNAASAEEPVPAVILAHGSGSHNLDLSLFDNRVFWDIAEYLSGNGIAVIRYNQRSWTHPDRFNAAWQTMTVWEEAIYDAVSAAELLRADERISDVFVVGLSLGGMLAPQIAESASLDGAVIMAGSPRALYEVQLDQNVQALTDMLEAGMISQEDANELMVMVEGFFEEAENMRNLSQAELAAATVFGLPATYQMSIVDTLPLPLISASNRPVLIMQGGRDFQVFYDIDFQIFLDYTEGMEHVTSILYENLNHLFMVARTNYNDLREYLERGNVDRRALRDIVEWIFANLSN